MHLLLIIIIFFSSSLDLLHDPAATIFEDILLVIRHATVPELIMGLLVAVGLYAFSLAIGSPKFGSRHKLSFGLSVGFFFAYLFYISTAAWLTAIGAVGLA